MPFVKKKIVQNFFAQPLDMRGSRRGACLARRANGALRLALLAACLDMGVRLERAGAQLTADTPPPFNFHFYDNHWDIPLGTPGECEGQDCQQYACTNRPEQPYCRGCGGNPNVWNVEPQDCLGTRFVITQCRVARRSIRALVPKMLQMCTLTPWPLAESDPDPKEKCSTCKEQCLPYSTGWQRVGPVAGNPQEPWTCKDSGKRCLGFCRNSWHKDCTLDPEICDCQAGSYRCIGEKKNNMIECDIERCDVTKPTYDAARCQCSKEGQVFGAPQTTGGQCTWMAAPISKRQMGGHQADKKCEGFNRGDTGVEPVYDCESTQCGRSQFTCQGVNSKDGSPNKDIAVCSTNSLTVCHETCLLDDGCVGVTWDPPSDGGGNSTRPGRCYKVNTACKPIDSATGEATYFKEVEWNFPAECMPRQQVAEDTWRMPKLGFSHDKAECRECRNVEVVLTVSFGSLDIGPPDNSLKCVDPNYDPGRDGNPPRPGLCSAFGKYVEDRFRFNCPSWPVSHDEGDGCSGIELLPQLTGLPDVTVQFLTSCSGFAPPEGCGSSVTFPGIVLKGPYQQVLHALHNVTYAPAEDQNSARLRSRIYSGSSSRSLNWPITKPFEELTMTVSFGLCSGCGHGGYSETLVRRYMMHILSMNDRPVLVNPKDTYSRPNYCEPTPELEDCVNDETGEPLEEDECHRCHFGPFWAYEGQSTVEQAITGMWSVLGIQERARILIIF